MSVTIRPATADDQQAIVALVRSERLKPTGIHWPNFIVAQAAGELVGAVQMRKHKDGSRELGSLVVSPARRCQGVASRLIEALLAAESDRVFVITGRVRTSYFARWGFQPLDVRRAPAVIKFNYFAGLIAGRLFAWLHRRPPNPLVVLDRGTVTSAG
jgi:amino-acid N-acetyltransferase